MSTAVPAPTRLRVTAAVGHALTIARRNLLHLKSDPEQLVGITIQPLIFLVLFVYVFGGAVAGSSKDYLQFALPGFLIAAHAFTSFGTALGLNVDFQRGLIDRFRSLPIARSAVVAGRILADAVRVLWGTLIVVGVAMLLGFRFQGGLVGALAGVGLVIAFGVTVSWPMAFIGISAKSPEAVNAEGLMLILPLTFASSVYAPASSMPGWLQAFVNVNPITEIVDATRALMLGGPVGEPLLAAVLWLVAITAVFAPLTILRYRRRM